MKHLLLVLAAVLISASGCSERAGLKVGDAAPPLRPSKWVQGEPVKAFAPGAVYVVEFWATWCGPCRVSIPHLNELHRKYKDQGLVVIGQNVSESDEDSVVSFVKAMGSAMTYRVALDDRGAEPDGIMAVTWMRAAKQRGIPAAFVIDKHGRIAWIGHPLALSENLLRRLVSSP